MKVFAIKKKFKLVDSLKQSLSSEGFDMKAEWILHICMPPLGNRKANPVQI